MGAFQSEVLRQPRGLLRSLQWFFALLAFATCAGYSSRLAFEVQCKEPLGTPAKVEVDTSYSYPFQLDHIPAKNYTLANCNNGTSLDFSVAFPGDFSSDAKFFVLVGVVCWLYTMGTLAMYTLLTDMYEDPQRFWSIIDVVCTALFAFFWLASSSAWANGLRGLKAVADVDSWLYSSQRLISVCLKSGENTYENTWIKDCSSLFTSTFGEANVSVIVGFLNVFLWSTNVWFVYKETKWYTPDTGVQNPGSAATPSG